MQQIFEETGENEMEMAWPLVSWIMSSSSSYSSSSSSEYDDDGDSDYDEAESPNDDVSCDIDHHDDAVDSVSPSTQSPCEPLSAATIVTIADPSSSTSKRRRTDEEEQGEEEVVIKRVTQKRIWSKEDELELLHGFLDHTKRCKTINNGRQQKDYVSSFYNEVKPELQLRFNKSQMVEKLRRLKRKYNQNIIANNKKNYFDQFCFKNPHDKATFEISHEIWNGTTKDRFGTAEDQTVKDNNVPKTRGLAWLRNGKTRVLDHHDGSPLLNKINNINDESSDTTGFIMAGLALNPIGLMKFGDGDQVVNMIKDNDEKWREQQIMELEVYLKRLELVQAQVRAALDKLKSSGG